MTSPPRVFALTLLAGLVACFPVSELHVAGDRPDRPPLPTDDSGGLDSATEPVDSDGDGTVDSADCAPDDPEIHPGAQEPCDGDEDLNCDGQAPTGCRTCGLVLSSGAGVEDGVYTLDIDGHDGEQEPFETWCDLATTGGGWNLVQRTTWSPDETEILFTDYETWRTTSLGSPDSGEVFRLRGEAWPSLMGQTSMMVVHRVRRTDGETCDPLTYIESGATLEVTESSAVLSSSSALYPLVDGALLEAAAPGSDCVVQHDAVPWFYGSCCTTCPTFGASYWDDGHHPMASYPVDSSDIYGQVSGDVCGGGPPANSRGYLGVAVMEVYLR